MGIDPGLEFIQDNHSRSTRGVVRGLHFQVGAGMAKLVRCARGAILDVGVDLRRGSPTYGQWEGVVLDDLHMRELYVPVGACAIDRSPCAFTIFPLPERYLPPWNIDNIPARIRIDSPLKCQRPTNPESSTMSLPPG